MLGLVAPRNRLIRPRQYSKQPKYRIDPWHPLSRGLVACWPLGDVIQGKTADISLYGRDSIVVTTGGAPSLVASHHGGFAINDNASSPGFYCTAGNFPISTFPVSFSAWVKTDADPSSEYVIVAVTDPTTLTELWMGIYNSSGNISFRVVEQTSGTNGESRVSISAGSSTSWHHYAATMVDSGHNTQWIDGVQYAGTGFGTANTPTGLTTATIAGLIYNNTNLYGSLNGSVEGVRIWNRSLSNAEVQQLYAEPYAGLYNAQAFLVGSVGGIASASAPFAAIIG